MIFSLPPRGGGGATLDSRRQLERARDLRREMTPEEQKLWAWLRKRHVGQSRFRRQVCLGPYIVDFVSFQHRLIVELDGGQHTLQREYDEIRTRWLNEQGYRVLRFWNFEVNEDLDCVLEGILNAVNARGEECEKRSSSKG